LQKGGPAHRPGRLSHLCFLSSRCQGPDGQARKGRFLRSTTGDGFGYFDLGTTSFTAPLDLAARPPAPPEYDPAKEIAAAEHIQQFELTGGVTRPVALSTGRMSAPLKATQTCRDELGHPVETGPCRPAWGQQAGHAGRRHKGWVGSGLVPLQDFGLLGSSENYIRMIVDGTALLPVATIHRRRRR